MSKPVTDSALDRAWPGSGFPNTSQSRTIHGNEDREGDGRRHRDECQLAAALEDRRAPDGDEPGQAEEHGLVAGQGRESDQDAEGDDLRAREAHPSGIAKDARHQQARGEGERRERHRRVGQGGVEDERQVDRARQPGPERQDPSAAEREPALRGSVGAEAPGEDRHDRADHHRAQLGRRERRRRTAPSGSRPGRSAGAARPRRRVGGSDSGGVP